MMEPALIWRCGLHILDTVLQKVSGIRRVRGLYPWLDSWPPRGGWLSDGVAAIKLNLGPGWKII